MRPLVPHDPTGPVVPTQERGPTHCDFWRDERGEIDALDLALLGLMLGALGIVLGGPAEALAAAERVVHLFVAWIS